MEVRHGVVIVGGGVMGAAAAYWLSKKNIPTVILDQYEVPSIWGASADHLRAFRLTYGKDSFYTDLAVRSMPLWLALNQEAGDKLLVQNGVLELAVKDKGYEEQSLKVLKDMKLPCDVLQKADIKRHYPMINTRAVKWGLFHKDGGMIWATRAASAMAGLAQRKGLKVRPQTKIVSILKDKNGIKGLKDSHGRLWQGEKYLFAAGAWTTELLKSYGIPLKVTTQQQLYFRPPNNRGRYRPEHFPVFAAQSKGLYGFPLHIHGFMKIGDHTKGSPGKPGPDAPSEVTPKFEKKVRAFFKHMIPDLSGFNEQEGKICHYTSTPDDDFILDRLPDAPNAVVMAGFSGHGFKFAPLMGKVASELLTDAQPEINLTRFRLSRFKLKKG